MLFTRPPPRFLTWQGAEHRYVFLLLVHCVCAAASLLLATFCCCLELLLSLQLGTLTLVSGAACSFSCLSLLLVSLLLSVLGKVRIG